MALVCEYLVKNPWFALWVLLYHRASVDGFISVGSFLFLLFLEKALILFLLLSDLSYVCC